MSATNDVMPREPQQAAAIPFRIQHDEIQFCLVTSSSGRWIFPKGGIENNETYVETALIEAEEEAGLRGEIIDGPLGCYEIEKDGATLNVVAVLMRVTESDEQWKESDWRERKWMSCSTAIELLPERELQELVQLAIRAIQRDG